MKIKNTQKITNIVMHIETRCFCPLGNDWYTAKIDAEFNPDEYYPDYLDVQRYVDRNIKEQTLTIEDLVAKLYEHIETEYKPFALYVDVKVDDAAHFPVEVCRN